MAPGAPASAIAPATRRHPALVATLAVLGLLLALGFLALGQWQVRRLAWKTDLIARVERQLAAAPSPLPSPADWPAITRERDEYRRVQAEGEFDFSRDTLVAASTELGGGYWVLTPLRVADPQHPGAFLWVLVNRGFIPPGQRAQVPHGEARQRVTGLLRLPEPAGSLLQKNEPAAGRWYSRDVAAIAAARGLRGPVAPFFLDAQASPQPTGAAPSGWPRAGLTVIAFTNNHWAYALTWFALAAIMLAAVGYLLVDDRRQRRAGASLGDHPSHTT